MSLPFHHDRSEPELTLRKEVAALTDQLLRPEAEYDDKMATFRPDAYRSLAAAGLMGLVIPKLYGGQGLPSRFFYAIIEEIARASPAYAISIGVNNLVQGALLQCGTEPQKTKYLPRLANGEWIGAFSLSEAAAGSDAASLRCSARKNGSAYVINGTKMWCSTAGQAQCYLLMARTDGDRYGGISAFLIDAGTPGFRVGKQEKKMGLRASPLAELVFENCEIPETQRLGQEGEGLRIALSQLDPGRVSIGTVGMGIGIECLEWAIAHGLDSASLEALGQNFAELQALQLLVVEATKKRDRGEKMTVLASMVKLLGSDLAMKTASEVLALFGFEGVRESCPLQRAFRDAKALQIVEGTNQIQRVLLARAMGDQSR